MANVLLFGFQNCGKAKMGVSGDPSLSQSLGNEAPMDASCPASQAPIGLNGAVICANIHDRGTAVCGMGEYLYGYDATGGARCILVTDRDPSLSVCDLNRQLESYTSTGSMTCVRMPGARPNYDCPPGEYLRGVTSGQAVCSAVSPPPPSVPGNYQCPAGSYLRGVSGGNPICESIVLPFPTSQSCPAGQAIVGLSAGQLVCQALMPPPHPDAACSNEQMVAAQASGAVTCIDLPERDLVHYCPQGQYLSTVSNQGYACATPPTPDHVWNGSCGQGEYVAGFIGGQPICVPRSTPDWLSSCPKGTYLNAIQAGAYICKPFDDNSPCQSGFELIGGLCKDRTPPRIEVTLQPVSGPSRTADIAYTVTDRDSDLAGVHCELDGAPYANCDSPVHLTQLSPGFHQFVIVARDIEGNESSKTLQWTVSTCAPGDSISCPIANGTGAMMCKADGSGYESSCVPRSCHAGYEAQGNACVQKACDPGYVLRGGKCVDVDPPVIALTKRPTDGNDRNVEVIYTVTDAASGVKSVSCRLDNKTHTPCASPLRVQSLAAGYHEIAIFAVDNAGNQSSRYIKWTIGNACTPNASVSCDVANGTGAKRCAADGSGYGACAPSQCDAGFELKNGQCVKLSCPAGHEVSGNACVDRTNPVARIVSGPAALTSSASARFVFEGTDEGSGVDRFECSLNGATYERCTSPKDYTGLGAGSYQFFVRVTDKAGNTAEANYLWKVTACEPGAVKSCSVANGSGQMQCRADGSGYEACAVKSCEAGYSLQNGVCAKEGNGGNAAVCRKGAHKSFFVELWPRLPSTLPASCQSGVEIWNVPVAKKIVLKSVSASGTSVDRQIDLDYATYGAANSARITAKLADGSSKVIFEPCLISTYKTAALFAMTAGLESRPVESAIRDFRVVIPKGTVELTIQGLDNNSPWYLRAKGLCEFKITQPVSLPRTGIGVLLSLFGGRYRAFGDDAGKQTTHRVELKSCEVKFQDWSYSTGQQTDPDACLKHYWVVRKQNWWKKVVYVKFDGKSIRDNCERD